MSRRRDPDLPDGQLLDVAGPLQVFASCNDLLAERAVLRPTALRVVAAVAGRSRCRRGWRCRRRDLPAPVDRVDTLIVAGGRGVDAGCRGRAAAGLAAARAACRSARRLGLHRGVPAGGGRAARWPPRGNALGLLRRTGRAAIRAVRVEADPIFIADGAFWTSAGVTAGIDLALAMIEAGSRPGRRRWPWPGGWWCSSSDRVDRRSSAPRLELQRGERFRAAARLDRAPISPATSRSAGAGGAGRHERAQPRCATTPPPWASRRRARSSGCASKRHGCCSATRLSR